MISPFLLAGLYIAIGFIAMTASFYFMSKAVKDNDYTDQMMVSSLSGFFWPFALAFWILIGVITLFIKYFNLILKYSKNR